MNRGLLVVAGVSVLVTLVLTFILVQEKSEKQAAMQENNQLKNQVNNLTTEVKKIIDLRPIPSKEIAGFGRDLSVDKA